VYALARRTGANILIPGGDLPGAWEELEHSLAILGGAASAHEAARTRVAMAALAPALGRRAEGQRAIDAALPALRAAGARRDLDEAVAVAQRQNYAVSF
jgi:hypothetical protein